MKQNDLADEIRGAGLALRYADGPVVGVRTERGKRRRLESPGRKLRSPDWLIIRYAATCSTCDAVATENDIEFAQDAADCYQSFARLIWPCIAHEQYCKAKPYLRVSKKSMRMFAKVKARFEAKRRAREEAERAGQSRKPKPDTEEQPAARSGKRAQKKSTPAGSNEHGTRGSAPGDAKQTRRNAARKKNAPVKRVSKKRKKP